MVLSDHEQDDSSTLNTEFGGYQYAGSSFRLDVPAYQAADRPAIDPSPRLSIMLPQETVPTSAHQGTMAYPASSVSSYEYCTELSRSGPSMFSYGGLTMGYPVIAPCPPDNMAAREPHLRGPVDILPSHCEPFCLQNRSTLLPILRQPASSLYVQLSVQLCRTP
jgi:hypothetical protein